MTEPESIIERYWYSIDWDVESLWALNLPAELKPIRDLQWHMDVPVWPNNKGLPYTTSPAEVLALPVDNPREYARITDADLNYPIEVYWHKKRWMILDGIHRLAKAVQQEQTHILVRKIPDSAVRQLPIHATRETELDQSKPDRL